MRNDMILNLYNDYLRNSKIKVTACFNPMSWVIGIQWLANETNITIFLPILAIRIYRKFKEPYGSIVKLNIKGDGEP